MAADGSDVMTLTCVVDNAVEHASTLWGEHGLAFVVETGAGRVLLDAGQSGLVLLHNLKELDWRPRDFSAVVSSHAHADHTGGLLAFLEQTPGLPLFAHTDLFRRRYAERRKKPPRRIGPPAGARKFARLADLRLSSEATEVLPGLWTTGEIRRRSEPEGRSPRHLVRLENGSYVPDPYRDDLSLVWQGSSGLVVILGCAHAGVLNILSQAAADFRKPISAVIGGMHLHDAEKAQVDRVATVLAEVYGAPWVYPNHCTGVAGLLGLRERLGDRVKPCPAGTTLEF